MFLFCVPGVLVCTLVRACCYVLRKEASRQAAIGLGSLQNENLDRKLSGGQSRGRHCDPLVVLRFSETEHAMGRKCIYSSLCARREILSHVVLQRVLQAQCEVTPCYAIRHI